jgi:hypothetical protein
MIGNITKTAPVKRWLFSFNYDINTMTMNKIGKITRDLFLVSKNRIKMEVTGFV